MEILSLLEVIVRFRFLFVSPVVEILSWFCCPELVVCRLLWSADTCLFLALAKQRTTDYATKLSKRYKLPRSNSQNAWFRQCFRTIPRCLDTLEVTTVLKLYDFFLELIRKILGLDIEWIMNSFSQTSVSTWPWQY